MANEAQVREHFRRQAVACRRLGSPFTARVCDLVASRLTDDTEIGRRILSWPDSVNDDAVALRFCGALHALVLSGKDTALRMVYPVDGISIADDGSLWRAINSGLQAHDRTVSVWLDSPPQTNEVARAAMILPALMRVSQAFQLPLALYEIGTSAGLTLQLEKFCYDYAGRVLGDSNSPVQLSPKVMTPPPLLSDMPKVVSRQGCDLNPLNPSEERNALRLRSYVWPDQQMRQERMNGAISLFTADPPNIEKADAAEWVERQLLSMSAGVVNVFFHTIVWQYFSEQTSTKLMNAFEHAGQECTSSSPLALVGMDADTPEYARLHLTTWSGSDGADGKVFDLARVDYHGRWIDWTAVT